MNILRLATVDDIDIIFDIRTSVKENHLSNEQLTEMGITPTAVLELIKGSACTWVIENENIVVGFSIVDFDTGSVFATFVHPDHEGHGIGKKLMAKAEALLFEKFNLIWLETDQQSRAYQFYKSLGWRDDALYTNGDVKMVKEKL